MGFFSDDSKELNTKKGQTNGNLHKAKNAKNDKFYTQLTDIEKELMHYKDHFKDKVVYCNCDDPTFSNFWVYFHLNFEHLGLKKLIATFYHIGCSVYAAEYTGGNDNDCNTYTRILLNGNGDFRSEECIEILKRSDIVVTNPPFSLFREYVAQLMEYEKEFLIIGNKNSITYKEFFPLLKDNKVWIGYESPAEFGTPEGITKKINGLSRWFTNLDIKKRHEKLILWKNYTSEEFPTYDNYDAINVDKVTDIPCDYDGVMGVPITFMDKYNPEQFEIIGLGTSKDLYTPTKQYINPKKKFTDGRVVSANEINSTLCYKIKFSDVKNVYYTAENIDYIVFQPYARILVQRILA